MAVSGNEKSTTIEDIANALGLSKSTVSRSISGKGRISEDTRQKVLDYVEVHNYKPNPIAKGLSESRCYNVGWVIPAEAYMTSLSFYDQCMQGVIDAAAEEDCDVLITTVRDGDISGLKRVVLNRKVDGIILGRTMVEDASIRFMKESGLPFVVVGSTDESGVIQVDNDHEKACRELAGVIRMKGVNRAAFIGGTDAQVVTRVRKQGFVEGIAPAKALLYMDCFSIEDIDSAVEAAVRDRAECIVCEDDRICYYALVKLQRLGIEIPAQMKIASFYDSRLLENNRPPVTALRYDPRKLGEAACRTLMSMLKGEKVETRSLLDYEVLLKASTQ